MGVAHETRVIYIVGDPNILFVYFYYMYTSSTTTATKMITYFILLCDF